MKLQIARRRSGSPAGGRRGVPGTIRIVSSLATIAALLFAACGKDPAQPDSGDVSELSIGPNGGTIATDDGGLTLTVPPGALDRTMTIRATPMSPPASLPIIAGTAWDLQPDGIRFALPAELTLRYDPATVSGDPATWRVVTIVGAAGQAEIVPNLGQDATAHTVSGAIFGFGGEEPVLRANEGSRGVGSRRVRPGAARGRPT
jgi:hypothetical protein